MQKLLEDLDWNILELKHVINTIERKADPTSMEIAKHVVKQMHERLDTLQLLLNEIPNTDCKLSQSQYTSKSVEPILTTDVVEDVVSEPVIPMMQVEPVAITSSSSILGESIKSGTDLRHAISLNDSFRFTRELFDGDVTRMNEVVRQLGEKHSLDEAMEMLTSIVHLDEKNEAVADFIELLKKYFN